MGNSICTSSVPITMEDIFLSKHSDPNRHILSDRELIPNELLERYLRYQHNFKAFSFRQTGTPEGLMGRHHNGPGLSDQIVAEPIDLSQPKVWLEESVVYMLLHVQRLPTGRDDSAVLVRESDADRYGGDQAPPWTALLGEVFTPRGLASTLSTSIGKPIIAAASAGDDCEFHYSIHMLNGVRAGPLLSAVSVLHALRLERCLSSSEEVVRRVFFNYSARASTNPEEVREPVPVGEIATRRAVQNPRARQRSARLTEAYAQNAILRILHRVRTRTAMPPITAAPSSARGAASLGCTSPRGITPRGKVNTPTCPGSYVFCKSPTLISGVGAQRSQGPPVLEVPRLRFSHETSHSTHTDAPLNVQRQSTTQTPRTVYREGNTSASNLTPSRTPHASTGSPRFPVISSLRLSEYLLRGASGSAPAANDANGGDTDEIRMTEERLQKLKAASPQVTEILPWLFVGGEEAARDRSQLLEKGITSVVNTVAFSMGSLHDDVFRYLGLYVSDSPDEPIFSLFPVVIRFIEEAHSSGGKTFVHCHQGVSRSCSFVIAYIMWRQGMCYDRAYEFVRSRRNVCSPNAGFYVNLLLWESQLATPVLNKAYAFLPYTEYLFPFSFRPALAFRLHQKAHDDDDAHIINPLTQTVYENNESYVVDPRLCYGIILGDRSASRSGGRAPLITSYFFADDTECDQVVRRQARDDWESFILYNFYHGPVKTTWNNKGECLTFSPLPSLGKPTEAICCIREFGRVVNENVFGVKCLNGDQSPLPEPVLAHNRFWDLLLARSDMFSCFANHVAEEQRMNLATFNRKRKREEERLRLARLTPTTPRQSPRAVNAGNGLSGSRVLQPLLNPPVAAATTAAAAAGPSLSSSAPLPLPQPLPSIPSLPIEPVRPLEGHDIEVYAYPFDRSQLTDIIDASDLKSNGCYAIVVPCAAAAGGGVHKVFLWLGSHCGIDEAEVWEAYRRTLGNVKGVRLTSGEVLKASVEETVYEGEEPDDLLLALD